MVNHAVPLWLYSLYHFPGELEMTSGETGSCTYLLIKLLLFSLIFKF